MENNWLKQTLKYQLEQARKIPLGITVFKISSRATSKLLAGRMLDTPALEGKCAIAPSSSIQVND